MYNSLTKLFRRIKKKMRESYSTLLTIAVGTILVELVLVTQPLFSSPTWSNALVVLIRFAVAFPIIALFVGVAIFVVKKIANIDKDRDANLTKQITDNIKTAFKEALKEDREEQRKDEINNGGNW